MLFHFVFFLKKTTNLLYGLEIEVVICFVPMLIKRYWLWCVMINGCWCVQLLIGVCVCVRRLNEAICCAETLTVEQL